MQVDVFPVRRFSQESRRTVLGLRQRESRVQITLHWKSLNTKGGCVWLAVRDGFRTWVMANAA